MAGVVSVWGLGVSCGDITHNCILYLSKLLQSVSKLFRILCLSC